uniref:HD domain-containing protein n=1 Tax=Desulfobacca acetoxidans TaxID=60893 RepID=A0A7V4GA08_9BACT
MTLNPLQPSNPEEIARAAAPLAASRGLAALLDLAQARKTEVFLVGGTVRDLLLERFSLDLDFAVSHDTLNLARELARILGGTFVLLDEGERTARVVAGGEILDLAEFRGPTLEADLRGRDFTINAMALDLRGLREGALPALIDPLGGRPDLAAGRLRLVSEANLAADPLRLLRAYRFAATLGFTITPETREAIRRQTREFPRVAGERVRHELFLLLGAPGGGALLPDMDEVGLLTRIFPELEDLRDVPQDGFHHLEVFQHSLETVAQMEKVLARPGEFFRELSGAVEDLARKPGKAPVLKLAALFHDAGKPLVQERRSQPERYTFYQHERVGVEIWEQAAARLRLSQAETRGVSHLIAWHMRPFLLLPLFLRGDLSLRALGRMVKAAKGELAAGFTLAMADSLAAQGPQKPPEAEVQLSRLADAAWRFHQERLLPQESQPRLLTGEDLKALGLTPGPEFRRLLEAVAEAQWEGQVASREEALALVQRLVAGNKKNADKMEKDN